jgi:hypothetical protein
MRQYKRPTSYRSQELLGKTFVDRQNEVVLKIGKDEWSRQELVEVLKCGNFAAAARLTKTLQDDRVNSVVDACRHLSLQDLLEREGVGETTAYVFMCAVDAVGKDPVRWCEKNHTSKQPLRTLATEKRRARAVEAAAPSKEQQAAPSNGSRRKQ